MVVEWEGSGGWRPARRTAPRRAGHATEPLVSDGYEANPVLDPVTPAVLNPVLAGGQGA